MKKLLCALLVIFSMLTLASCTLDGLGDNGSGGDGASTFDPNNVTMLSAYTEAQALGFTGTLDQFISMISGKDGANGKDGVGITNVLLDGKGNLIIVLSDGKTIDCGKVVGSDGKDGAPGKDGITPTIEISEDGYWVINGEKSEYKAIGTDGANGTNGTNGTTPTIEISDDGYWVINGVKTEVKARVEYDESVENPQGLDFYLKDDGTYAVSIGAAKYLSKIEIPAMYRGKAVTEIAFGGFYQAIKLTDIVIPNSVSAIGEFAFNDCKNLKSIVIPDGVTSIGEAAFSGCSSLESIVLPFVGASKDAVEHMSHFGYIFGYSIFESEYSIPYGDDWYLYHIPDSLKSVTITGEDITEIQDTSFAFCTSLKNVVIPKGVTKIGNAAFVYCIGLVDFSIPERVTEIGVSAFEYCIGMTSIVIGEGVMSIGDRAFCYCEKLVEVINKSSLDIVAGSEKYGNVGDCAKEVHSGESKIVDEGGYLFYTYNGANYLLGYKGDDTDLILPKGYNGECYEIYSNAFYHYKNIRNVSIPNSVIAIGASAFEHCTSLTNVVIPDSVTSIGTYAFDDCDSLTSVVIGNNISTIGSRVFYNCDKLNTVVIGKGVIKIEHDAFEYCSNIAFAYYCGTQNDWYNISHYGPVSSANVYFYSERKPEADGRYWHYINGVITHWFCATHTDYDYDYICDICEIKIKQGPTYNYNWSQTEVLFEMNEHANGGELTSSVRRYYAGADVDHVDDIDTAIRQRNKDAANITNVKPKYIYLADGNKEYNWGANVGRIQQLTNVGGSNCPDIFVNHSYDLTSAQIRGCFANLLDTSWALGNHFYFTHNEMPETENYFDTEAGEGYFYEYMRSLSLTPDTKLYCLASNYTVDAVRAMIVIPVNVTLMNSITTTETKDGLAGDRDIDGDHDIVDFYEHVWNNEWTYDALAAYSNAIFQGNKIESANTDFADDVVGFILGTNSGMQGAAMLYSSSVDIIEYNATTGKYEYPATNADLTAFAKALSDLMTQNASKGICTVNKADVNEYDSSATSELMGIRHKFANDGVLFGAPAMVGSLEDTEYQEMRKDQGFGVVPVPLYKPYEEGVNEYNTLVHNIARIVAVAKCSTEKSQASAYLDYVSRNSADILDEYYTVQLASAVSGGEAGANNNKMMTYIRNHIRTCFDKTFEDSIADYMLETDKDAYNKRWHYMLQTEKFSMPTISTQYEAYYLEKQRNLDIIYAQWNTLQ